MNVIYDYESMRIYESGPMWSIRIFVPKFVIIFLIRKYN